jgi:hypothetical protein
MKNRMIGIALIAMSVPCSAYSCFDSDEYKDSLKIAKDANHERANEMGVAVAFLEKTQGLDFDQALKEVMQQKATPETLAYDEELKNLGAKIQASKLQSPTECTDLIKLQREYENVGKNKIQAIVNEILTRPVPNANLDSVNSLIK